MESLCAGYPDEFVQFMKHVKGLTFEEQPNYSYLKKLLRELFLKSGFENDFVFDCTV